MVRRHVRFRMSYALFPLIAAISFCAMTLQAQIVNYNTTTIANPAPDIVRYEKVIGHFTSASHLSYFLGTDYAAYIFDPTMNLKIVVATDGSHYERAKAYKASPTDQFDSVIAAAGGGNGQLVAYWNPANWNGGNANAVWGKYAINRGSGCHDLYVIDLDGDGKQDVACSGTYLAGHARAAIFFQNSFNDWTGPVNAINAGDGIAPIAINGVNGGARTNLVGCDGGTLFWYKNSGRTPNWPRYAIGDCNGGAEIGTLNVGNRDIIGIASNETEPSVYSDGFVTFDPGPDPNPTSWKRVIVDNSYRDVHQIAGDRLNGIPFFTLGEQEQASYVCNSVGYDDHPGVAGCRVAIFPWNGNGFSSPTVVATLGTQNQALYQENGVEYMAGANHGYYGAHDPAYHVWTFTFSGGATAPATADGN